MVTVVYSDYVSDSKSIKDIKIDLFNDIEMTITAHSEDKTASIAMKDTIADNTELEGTLDSDKLTELIKALSNIRNQIK